MNKQEEIKILKEFRNKVELVRDGKAKKTTRSEIAQLKPIVLNIMKRVKTLKTMMLYPPPAIGGPVLRINPIESIYDVPFNMHYEMRNHAIDMLDETIGVLQNESIEDIQNESNDDIWQIMHPEIIRVAKPRVESGFYADAVVDTFKEIEMKVRRSYNAKSGDDKQTFKLMLNAFAYREGKPILKFKPSSEFSDSDIQEGYMHIFAEAMKAIRNPKSHENDTISREDALRKLAFASMLMYKLDTIV